MEEPIEVWEFLNSPVGLAMRRWQDEQEERKFLAELEKRRKIIQEALDRDEAS